MPTWLKSRRQWTGAGHLPRLVSPRILPNFKCHSTAKLCPQIFCTFFSLDGFGVFKEIFWEGAKVLEWHKRLRE
jgi:hypothetical protein